MEDADVCLGTFGTNKKILRYIPNKIFESIAMRKPLITQNLPTFKEAGFENGKHLLTCKAGNPQAIAKKILLLKGETGLRNKIARNGYELFRKRFTTKALVKDLKHVILEAL